jgi:ketosteroid isomerase-like protein
MRRFALLLVSALAVAARAVATSESEVLAAFDHFVAAQNAHDLPAVRGLLLDDPGFLWITRGSQVWGREAALARFQNLYEGTWSLDVDRASTKVVMRGNSVAQLVSNVKYTIGAPAQPAIVTPFILAQVWVHTSAGWKLGSLLPVPLPVAPAN